MPRRHVYLVPGFFGFSSLGELNYFHGVSEVLREELARRGVEASVFDCTTKPTASIRRRADWVLDEVISTGGLDADELHFVGHSTGGLDLRLMLTPGVRLRADDSDASIGDKAVSCITVATPHYGTPLAGFLTTLPGRHLLRLLALMATSSAGRHTLYAASRLIRLVTSLDDHFGFDQTFLDVWTKRLLGNITLDREDPVFQFFKDVSRDQGAVIQLTPEAMNLFNAAVTDRPNIHYASLVTAAPPPPHGLRANDALHPARLGARLIFAVLYQAAAYEHPHYPYPHPGRDVAADLSRLASRDIGPRDNDGVVPTLSQVYGPVLGLARCDHLDIVGQFDRGTPHSDWLPCGGHFDDTAFRQVWSSVAEAIAGAASARAAA